MLHSLLCLVVETLIEYRQMTRGAVIEIMSLDEVKWGDVWKRRNVGNYVGGWVGGVGGGEMSLANDGKVDDVSG